MNLTSKESLVLSWVSFQLISSCRTGLHILIAGTHMLSNMAIPKKNSFSLAMVTGRLSCIPLVHWHFIPISAVPYGPTLSATRWTAKPWMIQQKKMVSHTSLYSICGIKFPWPRICRKRNCLSFPVSQNLMKPLGLTF